MKVAVYEDSRGELRSWNPDMSGMTIGQKFKLIGYEERNIEPVKKTVTKEVGVMVTEHNMHRTEVITLFPAKPIPASATNIRILYDTKE